MAKLQGSVRGPKPSDGSNLLNKFWKSLSYYFPTHTALQAFPGPGSGLKHCTTHLVQYLPSVRPRGTQPFTFHRPVHSMSVVLGLGFHT